MSNLKNSDSEDGVRLRHMLDAAQQTSAFMEGRSREDLDNDTMLMLAVVRLVEIIGEAAQNTSKDIQSASPDIPWRQIKGIRNRLAHAYFDVDLDVIWDIIENDLEQLIQTLERLLDSSEV